MRKLLHMSPGALPFLMHNMPHEDPLDTAAIWFLTIVTVILTVVFLACFRIVRRPGESDLLATSVTYPGTFLVTMLLFPGNLEFACVVIAVLAVGDGSAYIFGRWLGKTPLPWNAQKTWMGTLGFVLCAAPVAALAYWIEARPEVSLGLAIACGSAAAIAGAIAESAPSKITDNLRVGVAAAVAVAATHFAIG